MADRRLAPDDPSGDERDETVQTVSAAPIVAIGPAEPLANLPPLLRALRPVQWAKNLLVFAALIFTRQVFQLDPLLRSVGAFIAFCAVSSSIYLINDVRDREHDRFHPLKRFRPIARGDLSPERALRLSIVLALVGVVVAFFVKMELAAVVSVYLALMLGYNAGLKNVVMLDVLIIAAGFVLRAAGGAVAISVPISPWLYICTLTVALVVGFGKRRYELLTLRELAPNHRQNLESYSVALLDQVIAISAAAAILAYGVYTFESPALPQNHAMMITIPIVTYAVFRYLYLLYRKHIGGSPELLLVRDRPLLATVVIWVVVSAAVLYWA